MYKLVNLVGRGFTVNVNRMKPCLNPESWQPRAPVKPTVPQDRALRPKKPTVTVRSRLIPTTVDEVSDQPVELQNTSRRSSHERGEVQTPSSPVDDIRGDLTWSPRNLVRAAATYNGPITRQRARELARGLTEQIILEGNEDNPEELENGNMTADVREEEREVSEGKQDGMAL
jgi:hypothetical protein